MAWYAPYMDGSKRHENSDENRMNKQFGPAISNLLEASSVRHIWRLSFLVSFFVGPLDTSLKRRFGVSRPEVQILYSLTQHDGLRAQDICLITGTPKNTIRRSILQVQDKGYVRRKVLDDDKRAKTLELTDAGRELMLEVLPVIVHRQSLMRGVLNDEERRTFDALLSKIVFALPNWIDPEFEEGAGLAQSPSPESEKQ